MIRFFKKYSLFFFIFFISIWVSLASTSLNEQFRFSTLANQVFTFLLYLPFFLVILWKVVSDCFSFHLTKFNVLYYAFGVYYVALSVYRLLSGGEFKEGIYYAVVLFGAFSLYALITDKKLNLSNEDLSDNLLAILTYIVLYKVAVTFMEENVFGNPPINNLYSTSMLALLLPFMVSGLQEKKGWKTKLNGVLCCLSLVLILTCSSRAVVLLSAAVMIGLLLAFITNVTVIKWAAVSFASSLVLVSILAGLNVGKVRYSLYREFNISFAVSDKDTPTTPPSGATTTTNQQMPTSTTPSVPTQPTPTQPTPTTPNNQQMPTSTTPSVPTQPTPTTPNNQLATDTQEQINRSDAMRADLLKQGIEEVKKNFLFGTGDLYYTYDMGWKTMEQTAHNFLVECLVCFGLIGTLMILASLLSILIDFGFFSKKGIKNYKQWTFILLVCFYYFAFGMAQPSVFNTLVCPTFVMVITYHGRLLCPGKSDALTKTFCLLKLKRGTAHVTDQQPK